jgi:hypothetical protein
VYAFTGPQLAPQPAAAHAAVGVAKQVSSTRRKQGALGVGGAWVDRSLLGALTFAISRVRSARSDRSMGSIGGLAAGAAHATSNGRKREGRNHIPERDRSSALVT